LDVRSVKAKIISGLTSLGMCWGSIALVVSVPYFISVNFITPPAESVCCPVNYSCKAAATIGHWVGQHQLDGWKAESFTVTFHVSQAEWHGYSEAEQNDIIHYLATVIMRAIPEKTFLIRNEQGECVANGSLGDARLCDFRSLARVCKGH
jgi:hypothetical protein